MKRYYVIEGNIIMGSEPKIISITDGFQEAVRVWKLDEINRTILKSVKIELVEKE